MPTKTKKPPGRPAERFHFPDETFERIAAKVSNLPKPDPEQKDKDKRDRYGGAKSSDAAKDVKKTRPKPPKPGK